VTEDDDRSAPLSPAEEREVSRVLADAAGHVEMPPDVTDRLSGVLADLAEERSTDANVVPLRSRRRWPAALLAAAAVAVGGYAVGNLVGDGSVMTAETGDAARPEAAADSDAGQSAGGTTADREGEEAASPPSGRPVRLRSDQLEADVLEVLSVVPVQDLRRDALSQGYDTALKAGCRPSDPDRRGTWFRARYDGERALLLLGPERSGTVSASVFSCDGELLDSTTVPAP
jgi:hypothetical protein